MKNKSRIRALVIDDDNAVRNSLRFYLEDLGFEVFEGVDGQDGVEKFQQAEPDIVLVDLRMPRMSGHQVLESLSSEAPETPLIVISGTGSIKDTVKALRLGAWDYILKPVNDLSILKHAIDKAIERSRLLRENRNYQENLEKKVIQRTKELTEKVEEVTRFNRMAVGRERRIVELKRQINALLGELNRPSKYKSPELLDPDPKHND